MKCTIITGGRGAIGSRLAKSLYKDPEFGEIIILDNLSAGDHNKDVSGEFVYCDISDFEKLKTQILRFRPSYVFHLAAHFANQNSVDYPISDANANILGTINLMEVVKQLGNNAKVVYASSSCVYGKSLIMRECDPIGILDTPYAITKFAGEKYIEYYNHVQGVSSNIVRIFNTYGPGEVPGEYRNVITNFISKALWNQPLIITGNGEETRDFTYVADTADLLKKAALYSSVNVEIFNGGTGEKTKIIDLARLIKKMTGSGSEIIISSSRKWDHVRDRCADITKSKNYLGYNPSVKLEEGLAHTIKWIKSLNS